MVSRSIICWWLVKAGRSAIGWEGGYHHELHYLEENRSWRASVSQAVAALSTSLLIPTYVHFVRER